MRYDRPVVSSDDPGLTASVRRRAPRRAGVRRQVTVPPPLWETAGRLADELGTTPNDALIRLALDAASRVEREREVEARASAARAAVLAGIAEAADGGFLGSEEAAEAAMALRREAE